MAPRTTPKVAPALVSNLRAPLVDLTIGDLLRRVASAVPDAAALKLLRDPATGRQDQWTFSSMLSAAEGAAGHLLEHFAPGEHLALWSANSPEWLFMQFGAALAGLVLVPINAACRADDLTEIVHQSRAAGLIYDPSLDPSRADLLTRSLEKTCPELRHIEPLRQWSPATRPRPLPHIDAKSPALILFTSGTTGAAKGAVLSHHALVNSHKIFEEQLGLAPGSVWLNATPLATIAGCGLVPLSALWNQGVQVLLPRFLPELFFRAISEDRANWSAIVPTMATMALEHPGCAACDFSSFQAVTIGGSPVAPDLAERIERAFDAAFCMIYGQTEATSAATHGDRSDPLRRRAVTAGRAMPGRELRIADRDTGVSVPRGETGEICIRGLVMDGYFGMPQETAAALDSEGWLHTGDLGEIDDDGYLTVSGRLKDMIIRGGLNVYPREIEDVLIEHPSVAEAAVFGAPDPKWGEVIVAAIRPPPGCPVDPEEIKRFIASRIARYKVPEDVIAVEAFPLTPTGKIQKLALKDIYLNRPIDG
jgi:fatty-acyl-CoA synthase